MNRIALQDTLQRRERILQQEVAGTVVLLSLDGGGYYSLDGVGGRVWNLCDGNRRVSEIAALICQEYEAPKDIVERDLIELLTDLANEKLVVENTKKVDGSSTVP